MTPRAAAAALAGALAACTSFENPEVVLDLRVLAITTTPPEQVIDLDPEAPPTPADLRALLVPVEVCALLADPGAARGIAWELALCVDDGEGRCADDPAAPRAPLAAGVLPDPETAPGTGGLPPRACATVVPDDALLATLRATAEDDPLSALAGIDALVQLAVRGEDEPADRAQYGAKRVRVAARVPAARTANTNPTLTRIDVVPRDDLAAPPVPLPAGRCADQPAPLEVRAGARVRLTPIEPDGVREPYVLPTLDGQVQTLTEAVRYQWLAAAGNFSAGSTGGPRGVTGNPPPLFTDWRAPAAAELDGPTDVQLWLVQRDERLGVTPHLGCVRVVP